MTRQFDIGRQNETLMNEKHYDIFKVMENFLNQPNPSNSEGPLTEKGLTDIVNKNALWLDSYTNPNDADLKYFNGSNWNVLFKDKFKITQFLLNSEQPAEPIEGQLWIDDGTMKYYHNGEFSPIKANTYDSTSVNPLGFEDFLIISPMEISKNQIIDNFSEFLFAKTPIVDWAENKDYVINEGAIFDLHIYICKKSHTSSITIDITNKEYWIRLDFLNQFLVPNSYQDKFYINGGYVHQKVGWLEADKITSDPEDIGYSTITNTCTSFPVEMVNGKVASAVHVNPSRLNNIVKKFFKINKSNPIIEMPEENTEFYGIQGGIGRFLIKTSNKYTTDYFSVISNNTNCIQLSQNIANNFDFIYAIHYEFIASKIKQPGVLYKKKFKLQSDNTIWIGPIDPDRLCVFAQGLYYENNASNYLYDSNSGYLSIKETLQDYDNMTKNFDFSVLAFPKVYQGQVTDNFDATLGYRINLPSEPKSNKLIAFASGVQLHMAGLDVIDDPMGNPLVKYIPSLTTSVFTNSNTIYWAVAEINEYNTDNELVYDMWRGKTTAIKKDPYGVIIPIYRDAANPVDGALYFSNNDSPIMFVDGILVFQKEIEIGNDYISIYGLKEGQEVVLLGDSKNEQQSEYENSDRLIFEDSVSYTTVPTEFCDNTLVYLQNGIICDASAVYTSSKPMEEGYHGEIRLVINYSTEQWIIYNTISGLWENINASEMVTDTTTGLEVPFIDVLDKNARGYSSSRKSISFLQNLGNEVGTYYSYRYTDSIEKKLLIDYCYPNSRKGINNDYPKTGEDIPFIINYKHIYAPGKNELTVYLNGIRQNLDSPYDISHANSKNKECRTDKNNEFSLAIDDGTTKGKAIDAFDGYFVYVLKKNGEKNKTISLKETMSNADQNVYIAEGWNIELLSEPNRNVILYVIESCEAGESTACERKTLTYKNALAYSGAFSNNTYSTEDFLLTRGNIRVFINGIRQPYGYYKTMETLAIDKAKTLEAYRVIDARTIEFRDTLIGGVGGNEGNNLNPLFPIGDIEQLNGNSFRTYNEVLDEIVIETRRDYKLREITLPIKDSSGEFTEADGVPIDLYRSKDKIMIYINGLAYGKEYKIENNTIKLLNESITQQLGNSNKDIITFEWR